LWLLVGKSREKFLPKYDDLRKIEPEKVNVITKARNEKQAHFVLSPPEADVFVMKKVFL
jgi:hypothetical protein